MKELLDIIRRQRIVTIPVVYVCLCGEQHATEALSRSCDKCREYLSDEDRLRGPWGRSTVDFRPH